MKVPPAPSADDDEIQAASAKSVKFTNRDAWIPRYTQWAYDVFKNAKTDTPTEAQREVLLTVHFRAVKEEYEFLGEAVPQEVWEDLPKTCNISKPLLRLIHGLPGSGKSKLLHWLKEYFETVWLWTQGNEFSMCAPMNSMADNIGGITLHSFGQLAFKDRRGVLINTGRISEKERKGLIAPSFQLQV